MEIKKLKYQSESPQKASVINALNISSKARKGLLIARKIHNSIISHGLSKQSFAQLMEVQPSVITRWLSGSHNFTIDTLMDIEEKLSICLIAVESNIESKTIRFQVIVNSQNQTQLYNSILDELDFSVKFNEKPTVKYCSHIIYDSCAFIPNRHPNQFGNIKSSIFKILLHGR